MKRLLVNTPTGAQAVVAVGEGGGYFDAARVLWDERTDGALPEITLGGMVRQGNALVFDAARKAEHDAATAPKVPAEVTRRQARQALLLNNKLALVQPAINAILDPVQRGLMQIEWDDSQVFQRNRPSLIAIGSAIGLDSAAIDALFIQAAGL